MQHSPRLGCLHGQSQDYLQSKYQSSRWELHSWTWQTTNSYLSWELPGMCLSAWKITTAAEVSYHSTSSVTITTSTYCYSFSLSFCTYRVRSPAWGRGTPFPPCPFPSSSFALFLLFPFLSGFNYFLLSSIPFLSTRIVLLRFQAGGRRKRPNLGLVCSFYFVLSVFFS